MVNCVCSGDVGVGIKCDANMISDKEADVDFDIIPNANDTFTVKYIPPAAGRLTIKVLFTDKVQTHSWKDRPLVWVLAVHSLESEVITFRWVWNAEHDLLHKLPAKYR